MAVGSWDKEGVIKIVDGQLRRPWKEGTENTRQDSNSTPYQDSRQAYIDGKSDRNDVRKRSGRRQVGPPASTSWQDS